MRRLDFLIRVVLVVCVVPLWASSASSGHQATANTVTPNAIEARILTASTRPARRGRLSPQIELRTLYASGKYTPLWLHGDTITAAAQAALDLLIHADRDGLDPATYIAPEIGAVSFTAPRTLVSPEAQARFDVALSAAMLAFLHDLHHGRIEPEALGLHLPIGSERHDIVDLLRSAIASGRIENAVEQLRPPVAQYRLLKTMLARYRDLQRTPPPPPISVPTVSTRPGDRYRELPQLAQVLSALGDLPTGWESTLSSDGYREPVVSAVRHFQERHGLVPDGVIGRETAMALRVPLADRVRQLTLALERLRWLPDLGSERLVALNIPMFRMWAWDDIPEDGMPLFAMNAIVGRAIRTETPVFVEQMREVIFRPYWNVPSSIVRGELLPLIRTNHGYLASHDMEIVRGESDDAPTVMPDAAALDELASGRLRLRQRPGPSNALGLIKFSFPNAMNVYMHGTPAQELFARSRRDFSHGCVRVEDPGALAEWALKEIPGWSAERIESTMHGTSTVRVPLARPIQVVLFYTTAAVMPEDGTVHFADDIYRHDARLARALAIE